jgi:hypothetical protein
MVKDTPASRNFYTWYSNFRIFSKLMFTYKAYLFHLEFQLYFTVQKGLYWTHIRHTINPFKEGLQWSSGSNLAEAVGFFGRKNPSFGGEVNPSVPSRRFAACKRSLHLPWKSHAVGKIGLAISRPYFPPSLIEVSHVAGRGAPLEMTEETKSGAQRARS